MQICGMHAPHAHVKQCIQRNCSRQNENHNRSFLHLTAGLALNSRTALGELLYYEADWWTEYQ